MKGFISYLDQRAGAAKAEVASLEADGRRDEANFARVRANIYDVCKTVTLALLDRPGAGVPAIEARLEGFRKTWGEALLKAREHGNADAAAVEEVKLEALADAAARFEEAKKK